MVVSDKEDLSKNISALRNHGAEKSELQRHKEKGGSLLPEFNMLGYNYRMTDIQGAVGVCQMKKADYILKRRREIAAKYDNALSEVEQLITPHIPEGFVSGYQSYVCLFTGESTMKSLSKEKIDELNIKRNNLMAKLEERGISVRQGTHAVHTLGYYKTKYNLEDESYLKSYAADRLSIAFPLYAGMKDKEFDYVIKNLYEVIKNI